MPRVKQPRVKTITQPTTNNAKQPRVKAVKQLANVKVPDNQRPTCKVVKRNGQTGARIDPKGCKVRTTKSQAGVLRQYNKQGERKITLKTRKKAKTLAPGSTPPSPAGATRPSSRGRTGSKTRT
eukprot:COSAG02_NODE_7318_length_3065_cov_3.301079_3_plen_124_part_00